MYNVSMNTFQAVRTHFERVAASLLTVNQYEVEKAVRVLEQAKADDAFVWIVGNGGSAATSSHFANDLEKMCGIRAISVPDMTPAILAHGNDEGWEKMFANVIRRNSGPKDVVVAISCSGYSPNVIKVAEDHSYNRLIVLTGDDDDSKLAQIRPDALIMAPDDDIKVQEDIHLAVCHAIVTSLIT
jgi:D-sedoheptulose 7-phosphate isomerase